MGSGGVQCGFCIPGIVIRSVALLEANSAPSREEIAKALRGHLCRCTGYAKIIDAVESLAQVRLGKPAPALDWSGRVGTSLPRYSGADAVLLQVERLAWLIALLGGGEDPDLHPIVHRHIGLDARAVDHHLVRLTG